MGRIARLLVSGNPAFVAAANSEVRWNLSLKKNRASSSAITAAPSNTFHREARWYERSEARRAYVGLAPLWTARKSVNKVSADWYRCSGSFANNCCTIPANGVGTVRFTSLRDGGSRCNTRARVPAKLSVVKG